MAKRIIIRNGKKYIVTVPDWSGLDLGIGSAGGSTLGSYVLGLTDQFITVTGNEDFVLSTGSFTVEWFQRASDAPVNDRIFTIGVWPDAEFAVSIETFGGGIKIFPWLDGLGNVPAIAHSASVTLPYINTWNHFAIVRSSGSYFQILQNGVALRTFTTASDVYINADISSSLDMIIGGEGDNVLNTMISGTINNFRLVKGYALYSGSYTVPTSNLTAVSGTVLLLTGDSASLFTDSSGLNQTASGNSVSWSMSVPF